MCIKNTMLSLLLCFSTLLVFAKNPTKLNTNQSKAISKPLINIFFDPITTLLVGAFEKRLETEGGVAIPVSKNIYLGATVSNITIYNEKSDYNEDQIKSHGLGGFMQYNFFDIGKDSFFTKTSYDYTKSEKKLENKKTILKEHSIGISVGHQWVCKNRLNINFEMGVFSPAERTSQSLGENKKHTFSTFDRAAVKSRMSLGYMI